MLVLIIKYIFKDIDREGAHRNEPFQSYILFCQPQGSRVDHLKKEETWSVINETLMEST